MTPNGCPEGVRRRGAPHTLRELSPPKGRGFKKEHAPALVVCGRQAHGEGQGASRTWRDTG